MPTKLPFLRLPFLVILLALSGLLLAAGAAHASPAPLTSASPFEAFSEGEGEEEEGESEEEETECETAEEEVSEGELSQDEADEICEEEAREDKKNAGSSAAAIAEECILRSAHGQASLISNDTKLKLTLGYTAFEPVAAKLRVGNGPSLHRHLGRSGVLRLIESLHGHDAPKQLSVRIDIPSARTAGCPSRRLVLFPR